MSVKLIAENILRASHFLSATEQAGEYWGQPVPSSLNAGALRLLASGAPEDFTYNGTTTGDGNVGGTTLIDSVLAIHGDDYFISGSIAITSGACSGQSQTISDFAQATGTITTAAFTAQIVSGVTFTLTVAFASRDFRVELIDGGDSGDATFKFSHDGGTTYLGRDNPNQTNWLAEREIDTDAGYSGNLVYLIEAADGSWLAFWRDLSDDKPYYKRSTDKGVTWGAAAALTAGSSTVNGPIVLKYGPIKDRVLVSLGVNIAYSDDHGVTWGVATGPGYAVYGMIELTDGSILAGYKYTTGGESDIYCVKSVDGGFTWSAGVLVSDITPGKTQPGLPSFCQAANGDIVCAYDSDVDTLNQWEIKARISSDAGASWGSEITVLDYSATIFTDPSLLRDIDGIIYCAATEGTGDTRIVLTLSTDNGATWVAPIVLKAAAGVDLNRPCLSLIEGHLVACSYRDHTNGDFDVVFRGMWEAYSSNACPAALDALPQTLACGAAVAWHGAAGVAGDDWQFEAAYEFGMANLIEDSPSRCWRSNQDNISCYIVIDLGAASKHYVDGVAFFGCNVRTFNFSMNSVDSWGAPPLNVGMDLVMAIGACDNNPAANEVQDTSLLANYKDHELAGEYLRFTSGAISGATLKILDNVGEYLFVDGSAAAATTADTFCVFGSRGSAAFETGAGLYRYMGIWIPTQATAEGYYQIGCMIAGKAITLTDSFGNEYGHDHEYGVELLETPEGGMIPLVRHGRRRRYGLGFVASNAGRKQVLAMLDYISGRNIALVLDDSAMTKCSLVKLAGSIRQEHVVGEYSSFEAEFVEIL